MVKGWRFQVLKPSAQGDNVIHVTVPYFSENPSQKPDSGEQVIRRNYDYEILAMSADGPNVNFRRGSTLVNFVPQAAKADGFVSPEMNLQLAGIGNQPHFEAGYRSMALRVLAALELRKPEQFRGMISTGGRALTVEFWLAIYPWNREEVTWILSYRDASVQLEANTFEEPVRCPQSAFIRADLMNRDKSEFKIVGSINGIDFSLHNNVVKPDTWTHFAGVYQQGFGVSLDESSFIDFGNATELGVSGNFTVEMSLTLTTIEHNMTVLTKGTTQCVSGSTVPMELLYVSSNRSFRLSFNDVYKAEVFRVTIAEGLLEANKPYRLSIARLQTSEPASDPSKPPIDKQVMSYLLCGPNGTIQKDTVSLTAKSIPSSDAPLLLGRPFADCRGLIGIVSELRLFNAALETHAFYAEPSAISKSSLVGWWRFNEGTGRDISDSVGNNDGKVDGTCSWRCSPNPLDSKLEIYLNGSPIPYSKPATEIQQPSLRNQDLSIGHGNLATQGWFQMDELRIWNTARRPEEISYAIHGRINEPDHRLSVYYSMDDYRDIEGEICIPDHSGSGWHLHGTLSRDELIPSTAPVSFDAPLVCDAMEVSIPSSIKKDERIQGAPSVTEYGDIYTMPDGTTGGVLKRCYSTITAGQWHLTTGFKVGTLVSEWVAQVQTDPTLVGFVEGGPPIPKENYWSG
jgi:hypothetical protein